MFGNIVSGIANAVSSVIETVAGSDSILGKVTSALGIDDLPGMILGGPGKWLETLSDAINLPPIVGDILNCITNVATGNIPGAISGAIDAAKGIAVACGADKLAEFISIGKDIAGLINPAMFGGGGGGGGLADIISSTKAGGLQLDIGGVADFLTSAANDLKDAPVDMSQTWMGIFQDATALYEHSQPPLNLRA